jgi:hypothetical protein
MGLNIRRMQKLVTCALLSAIRSRRNQRARTGPPSGFNCLVKLSGFIAALKRFAHRPASPRAV